MSSGRRNSGKVLALVLLFSLRLACAQQSTQPAQEPPPGPGTATLQVNSRLVVLDVVVTNKHGEPVTGLTRADFHITEDLVPQTVGSFEPPSEHALPPGVLVHSSTDLTKIGDAPIDILVLDELNTPFEDDAYSRYSLRKFLQAQPAVLQPTLLLTTGDKSFSVLQDYTQDRAALEAALKRSPLHYPWRLSRNGGGGPDAAVRLLQSLQSLESIAEAAAGTPGRKVVLWVGKGFPSVDLAGLDDDTAATLQNTVRRCIDLLLRSRVTLYIVDPTALTSTQYTDEGPATLATLESETAHEPFSDAVRFSAFADATGGRVFSLGNDVDREIVTALQQGSLYYTLSYTPSGNSADSGKYRHIHIALDRPDLTATTRDGYYAAPSSAATAAAPADAGGSAAKAAANQPVLDVAGAALSKMVYTGLTVRAAQGAPGHFTLSISDASLSWQNADYEASTAALSIVAVCFSAKSKVLSHITLEKTLRSTSPAWSAAAAEVFTLPVSIPAGAARLRFVVRDDTSGRLGTADLDLPGLASQP